MASAMRPWALCLLLGFAVTISPPSQASDDTKPQPEPAAPPVNLEDPPQRFVPLHARTVEDQRRIEALQAYSAARALEERRMLKEAIELLEQAHQKAPDSLAILRRLSRLCFATGRTQQAITYSRKVIEADPNDTATLHQLVTNEVPTNPDAAETLLTSVLDNPKLDKTSPAYLLALHDLGMICSNKLGRTDKADPAFAALLEKAADAFAKLVQALDDKAANRLSLSDEHLILGEKPEFAYLTFGTVLLEAKRSEVAVKAFQRGLVYAHDYPQLTFQLARALVAAGKSPEALEVSERFLKQQPARRESYELIAQCLTALKRADEIIPRFEAASKAEPKNRAIQYALADRYNEIGQKDKANAIYEQLRANPPTPQDFAALSAWLLKDKRTDELIKLISDAMSRRSGLEALRPQIEIIATNPSYAEEILNAAVKLLESDPPSVTQNTRRVLAYIAEKAKKQEKLAALLRVAIQKDPTPQDYKDLADTLVRLGKFDEAATTIEEQINKYPNLKNPQELLRLGEFRSLAGKHEAALEALREVQKFEPNDPEVQRYLCTALSRAGKIEEAVEIARGALKRDPANQAFNQLVGALLVQLGKNDEAIAHYKGLLERFPNDEDLVFVARSGLSIVYVRMEEFDKGEAELEILLEKNPDDDGVNNDLGYLYADRGKNLEKAEAMIRKALAEKPGNGAYLDSMGWVLFKRGKLKEAIEPLEKAAATPDDTDGTIHDHLGDVYFRLQEYAKAKVAWDQAVKIAEKAHPIDNKRVAEILKKLDSLKELIPAPKSATRENP